MVERTFFPAYLPRVMIATRPTFRTIKQRSVIFGYRYDRLPGNLHFIVATYPAQFCGQFSIFKVQICVRAAKLDGAMDWSI